MSSYALLALLLIPVPSPISKSKPKVETIQVRQQALFNPIQVLLGGQRLQVTAIEHRVHFDYSIHERWPTRNLELDWFHLELFLRFRTTPKDVYQVHDWCTEVFGNARTPDGIGLYSVEVRSWGQDAVVLLAPSSDAQRDYMTSRYLGFRNRNNRLTPVLPNLISTNPELARFIIHNRVLAL